MSYELSAMTYEILLVTLRTGFFLNSLDEAFEKSTSHTASKCKTVMDSKKKNRKLLNGAVGWDGVETSITFWRRNYFFNFSTSCI